MRRGSASAVAVLLVVVAACTRAPMRTDFTTTSAALPRPGSLPPTSHTVDSTGFVDPAGRTSDQRDRTELSGMRPTETGTQVPTGTPGSGLPLPIEPRTVRRPESPLRGGDEILIGEPESAGTVTEAVSDAVTLAYCERDRACGRLIQTDAACLREMRSRYREELGRAECPYSFDVDAVVACLSAIRAVPCNEPRPEISKLGSCHTPGLCLAR